MLPNLAAAEPFAALASTETITFEQILVLSLRQSPVNADFCARSRNIFANRSLKIKGINESLRVAIRFEIEDNHRQSALIVSNLHGFSLTNLRHGSL